MCDTFVIRSRLAQSGRTTLAKNSDREPNEAQYLTRSEAADHAPGSTVRCTYIEVPQVAHTHALLGSRPWWMWGFEHGVNEHGLAIGNEAVWSRVPGSLEPGLLGMDLLRLTLERAASADEGLAVMTALLEQYGQSGSTSATRQTTYHNSFIIADATDAWILETAGRHWAAKQVHDWAAISNVYSIGADYDRISAGAIAHAVASGWFDPKAGKPFDFAAAYADQTVGFLPGCKARLVCAEARLAGLERKGRIALEDVFSVLRSHDEGDLLHDWRPGPDGESLICMHATAPDGSETAASMVAELPGAGDPDGPYRLWLSLGSPCLSSFVPFWRDSEIMEDWQQPGSNAPDAWWRWEEMQRLIEQDYGRLAAAPRAILKTLETDTLTAVRALPEGNDARRALSGNVAQRLDSAGRIITDLTRASARDVIAPRSPDPRGDYLARVEASRLPTSRRAGA
ncbi:C69 family dipeptidase [Dongia sp.]|uniref:C69 family dipeptidase n=1 Tax=Dongia sp. TaxID=1977262 RepID=UPI00374FE11F